MIKSFRQHLHELFDRPYPVAESHRIGSGITTVAVIYKAQTQGGTLEIEIANIGPGWEINFSLEGSQELTGLGTAEASRVLATVLDAVRQFLEGYARDWDELPKQIVMVSKTSEASRDKAYSALMRRFGSKYGYNITTRETQGQSDSRRTVTKATRVAEKSSGRWQKTRINLENYFRKYWCQES